MVNPVEAGGADIHPRLGFYLFPVTRSLFRQRIINRRRAEIGLARPGGGAGDGQVGVGHDLQLDLHPYLPQAIQRSPHALRPNHLVPGGRSLLVAGVSGLRRREPGLEDRARSGVVAETWAVRSRSVKITFCVDEATLMAATLVVHVAVSV